MKRLAKRLGFFLLSAAVIAACCMPASAADGGNATEPIRTVNDYDASAWTFSEGVTAEQVSDGGKYRAVRLTGAAGEAFSARTSDCDGNEFMIDLSVDVASLGEQSAILLRLEGEEVFADFRIDLDAEDYDVTLTAAGREIALTGVSYGDGGRIQVRLADDQLLNLETQGYAQGWNFVAGCDKWYNGQVNQFTGSAAEKQTMIEIGQALSAMEREGLDFVLETEGFPNGCTIDLAQLNSECYYDYDLFAAPYLNAEDDIYYNRVAFSWALPDATEYPRAGFRVECYCGEVLEQTYVYDNAYASSVSENQLHQNTEDRYEVTAYEQVDNVMSAVACYTVAFQYEPLVVRTLEGHFWYFIVAVIVLAIVIAAVIIIYVNYFDIKRALRGKKRDRHAV